jgi:hypothetical protein
MRGSAAADDRPLNSSSLSPPVTSGPNGTGVISFCHRMPSDAIGIRPDHMLRIEAPANPPYFSERA